MLINSSIHKKNSEKIPEKTPENFRINSGFFPKKFRKSSDKIPNFGGIYNLKFTPDKNGWVVTNEEIKNQFVSLFDLIDKETQKDKLTELIPCAPYIRKKNNHAYLVTGYDDLEKVFEPANIENCGDFLEKTCKQQIVINPDVSMNKQVIVSIANDDIILKQRKLDVVR